MKFKGLYNYLLMINNNNIMRNKKRRIKEKWKSCISMSNYSHNNMEINKAKALTPHTIIKIQEKTKQNSGLKISKQMEYMTKKKAVEFNLIINSIHNTIKLQLNRSMSFNCKLSKQSSNAKKIKENMMMFNFSQMILLCMRI